MEIDLFFVVTLFVFLVNQAKAILLCRTKSKTVHFAGGCGHGGRGSMGR